MVISARMPSCLFKNYDLICLIQVIRKKGFIKEVTISDYRLRREKCAK